MSRIETPVSPRDSRGAAKPSARAAFSQVRPLPRLQARPKEPSRPPKAMARIRPFVSVLALLALAACSDSSGPPGPQPEDELVFLRAAGNAPPLQATTVGFWAVAGDNREVRIDYVGYGPYAGDECLRFKVPGNGLLRRPDGSRIREGDSVFIRVTIDDVSLFKFRFEPEGLQFDPDHPAELRVSFKWAELDDVDGDGDEDDDDQFVAQNFAVWHQARAGQDWRRLGTVKELDLEEVRADITSFSQYALAGGTRRERN
jgi:hypothetical protein